MLSSPAADELSAQKSIGYTHVGGDRRELFQYPGGVKTIHGIADRQAQNIAAVLVEPPRDDELESGIDEGPPEKRALSEENPCVVVLCDSVQKTVDRPGLPTAELKRSALGTRNGKLVHRGVGTSDKLV